MAKKDKKKEQSKNKKGEKAKRAKKEKKLLKQAKSEKKKNKSELKEKPSTKALKREIAQLRSALLAHESAQTKQPTQELGSSIADLDELTETIDAGSVSERKKTWERHQYLRARYEHHLDSGSVKSKARIAADQDLRSRYGEQFGYTSDDLDSILS